LSLDAILEPAATRGVRHPDPGLIVVRGSRQGRHDSLPTWLASCCYRVGEDKLTETSQLPADTRLAPLVLIVEDDREQRETLCAMLDLEGFGHVEAANGREALEYLNESQAPCLVLLDLEMPVMNGWEFRVNQLADERLSRIPVVVVTANRKRLKNDLSGVEGFLSKPLNFEKLVTVLDRVCSRKKDSAIVATPAEA
jgi:CheY-like chemotaxis protein